LNLLPRDYRSVWLNKKKIWLTNEELKLNDLALYKVFIDMKYDEDIAVVFLSKKLSDKYSTYAIVYCDVIASKLNFNIIELSVLGYTNSKEVDFGLNINSLAEQINSYQKLTQYQYLEKYFIGECETMSSLKQKIKAILKFSWTNDATIEAF
tara:strand:- start:4736 stop:5191 length:456 start_codon:yes stop_codon:yes gene_type:complete